MAAITNAPVCLPVIDGMLILVDSARGKYVQTGFDSRHSVDGLHAETTTLDALAAYAIGQGFFYFNPAAARPGSRVCRKTDSSSE